MLTDDIAQLEAVPDAMPLVLVALGDELLGYRQAIEALCRRNTEGKHPARAAR